MLPKISLCIICGNEEPYIERFLTSFASAFDELCIVRAVGNQIHDKTIGMAKEWCTKNGKEVKAGEYFNEDWNPSYIGAELNEDVPATWPHVDNFAAARNRAWDLATGDYQLWGDCDDILVPGSAEVLRKHAEEGKYDQFFFRYSIPSMNEANFRERMFKAGIARWGGPVHENCHIQGHRFPGRNFTAVNDENVIYSHEPDATLKKPSRRNLRIVGYYLRFLSTYAYEMHRESFYQWGAFKDKKDGEAAIKWAEVAHYADTHGELRMQILNNLTALYEDKDLDHALELAYQAVRISPLRRETWGRVAELQMKAEMPTKAREATALMKSLPKPDPSGWPRTERYYGWEGLTLRTRTVRATGQEKAARAEEDSAFQQNGARFSLLHATRGRPDQALATRDFFFRAALNPLGIEHIFAIDEDDTESLEKLKHYRHVIVKEPNGCVKAWNLAAADSTGSVLVQLSDDWVPCIHWDELCWLALQEEAQKKKHPAQNAYFNRENSLAPFMGEKVPLKNIPLVLAIHDGYRTDDLLCMAIMTRARYEDQNKEMFSAEYFGVYSDNEFSVRAYQDGIVVKAKHINFVHRHPCWEGKKLEEMDATYQRQNARERYIEGEAIFNRRNPKKTHDPKPDA